MKTRRIIFQDLVKGVFGRGNVRYYYCENLSYISLDQSQVTEANYSLQSHQKFSNIFVDAYKGMVIIKSADSKDRVGLEYSQLLLNSKDYFYSLGIDIDEKVYQSVSESVRGKLFSHAITEIILPFIFDGNDPDIDAENGFKQVKSELEMVFSTFDMGYTAHKHAKANDLECIFDSEYLTYIEEQCKENNGCDLYADLVDTDTIAGVVVMPFNSVAISMPVRIETKKEEFSIESILGKYQRYPFSEDEPFISPFAWQAEQYVAENPTYTNDSRFPLSDVTIEYPSFIPRYFYYVTRINETIINRYKDEVQKELKAIGVPSSEEEAQKIQDNNTIQKNVQDKLDKELKERAVRDFQLAHKEDLTEYYESIVNYIEDMIRRITEADYSHAIRRDSDLDACQRFAAGFNIDYGRILKYMDDVDDPVVRCYELIEEKIIEFVKKLTPFDSRIFNEFEIFLDHKLTSHYNSIGKYLESSNLEKAIDLKKAQMSRQDNKIKVDVSNKWSGTIFVAASKAMEQSRNTYDDIYNVLKKYYTGIEKIVKGDWGDIDR